MISKLNLQNFKAFENLNLEFRPLTFILGQNNSGKSSIIAPFPLLIQTMESFDAQVSLLLNGIMGDFGTYKDIVYGNNSNRRFKISVSFDLDRMDTTLPLIRGANSLKIDLAFRYRSRRRELILNEIKLFKDKENLITLNYSDDSDKLLVSSFGGKEIPVSQKSTTSSFIQLHHFLPTVSLFLFSERGQGLLDLFDKDNEKNSEEVQIRRRKLTQSTNVIRRKFSEMEYIGAMRLPPSRTYLFTGEKRKRIGATGENTASMLVMDSHRSRKKEKRITESVSQWLSQAGMASELKALPISDRHFEIRVTHPVSKENQNIKDVGYGNSQVIPVLVGGYNLSSGATFFVEEPEIHLHPKAQSELGNFFYDLYERGVQSIVETHSEYLIIRLQQLVADKKIPSKDIVFYYVQSNAEGGKSVLKLSLDEMGKFTNELPNGFFPERLEEAKRLSQIRFQHLQQ